MVSVSPSMKGADLESAESLGHYLVNEFVAPAIDCTRKVIRSVWYPKLPPPVQLRQLSAALETDLQELYLPLDPSVPTATHSIDLTDQQKIERVERLLEQTGLPAFERIAAANGTTVEIERNKLRQRYLDAM